MKDTLYVDFIKTDGKKFRLAVPYPKKPVNAQDVKDIVSFALNNDVFVFQDGIKLQSFDAASLYTIESSPVEVTM